MKEYKKAAALLMGMLLCLGNTAAPAMSGYATDDTASVSDEAGADTASEEGEIEAGFRYVTDDSGNAIIIGCELTDKEITVPDTLGGKPVTELATEAFLGSSATRIVIPSGIEYISTDDPFSSCLALEEIEVSPDNTGYLSQDGILFSKDMKKLVHYPASKEGDSFAVPDGIEEIGVAAFAESKLKKITLPDSVKAIGRHSFSYCTYLEGIDLSNTSIEYIDVMAFIKSYSMTTVKLPDTLDGIGLAAFFGCSKLEEIEIPSSVTYIRQSAFAGTGLKEVRIPASVEEIGYEAFGYSENQEADSDFVIIGTPGSAAQQYCSDSDTEYGYANNFTFKSEQVAADEEEYSQLDTHPFEDYEYAIIDGEAYITFCVSMDDVITVPAEMDGYKVVGLYKGAFVTNEASEIILPEGLKTIGLNMFSSKLKRLTLPGSCELIEGDEPFIDCASLEEINVTSGDGAFSSLDGVLYDFDKKNLLVYPRGKQDKKFKAPAETEGIGVSAFCGNAYLEEANLTGITEIGDYAFENCTSLNRVKLSKDLTSVGYNAFCACPELKSVRLGSKLDFIGDYAFGFVYDQQLALEIKEGTSNATDPYTVADDFTIYTSEDTTAYKYAKACGINVVTNTYGIGGVNVNKGFLYVIIGIIAAAVLALVGIAAGKSVKNKKASKPAAKKTDGNTEKTDGGSDASEAENDEETDNENDEDN